MIRCVVMTIALGLLAASLVLGFHEQFWSHGPFQAAHARFEAAHLRLDLPAMEAALVEECAALDVSWLIVLERDSPDCAKRLRP